MICGDILEKYFLIYWAIISVVTVIATVYDKKSARKGGRRVSEAMLILFALLGGSAAELFTMKKIRHKTLHKSFMIGLPIIIFLHIALIIAYFLFYR
ncbi:MAG: DUF1294 domain-containing protein [Clostridia bacterium]|nr:DUF1294 domain-containing protein [Clostridia bacterium]